MHQACARIAKAIDATSPIDIHGTRYELVLTDIDQPWSAHLHFTIKMVAIADVGRYQGELDLGEDRLDDEEFFADVAVDTMGKNVIGASPRPPRIIVTLIRL